MEVEPKTAEPESLSSAAPAVADPEKGEDSEAEVSKFQVQVSRVLCQFFLRGRCQRENCEFTHDADKLKELRAMATADTVRVQTQNQDLRPSKTVEGGEQQSANGGNADNGNDKTVDATAAEISVAPAPATETPKAVKRVPRPPVDAAAAAASTPVANNKQIRRDSKGFENFDDYFSESDTSTAANTPVVTAKKSVPVAAEAEAPPAAANEDSVVEEDQPSIASEKDAPVAKEPEAEKETVETAPEAAQESVDKEPAEKPVEEIATEPAAAAVEEQTAVVAEEAAKPVEEAAPTEPAAAEQPAAPAEPAAAGGQETIDDIQSFIAETETKTAGESEKAKTEKKATVGGGGGKSKEEWVTLVFGENGEEQQRTVRKQAWIDGYGY